MVKWAACAAAVLLLGEGAALAQPTGPSGEVRVYADGQTATTFEAMVDRLAQADVVFIGENHDHAQGHSLELQILQALAARQPRTGLALEMFERDVQIVLDEYLAGLITEQQFTAASRPWPNYRTDYAPMVEFCRTQKLPVVASNAPRRYVNIVSRKGKDALGELPKTSRAFLAPLPYSMDLPPEYDRQLSAIFGEQHGSGAAMPGMPTPEHMKQAQALWDATMADSLERALRANRGYRFVHVNGAQHSDRGFGIADRLRKARPRTKITVVTIRPDAEWANPPADRYRGLADFVLLTPPDPPKPAPSR